MQTTRAIQAVIKTTLSSGLPHLELPPSTWTIQASSYVGCPIEQLPVDFVHNFRRTLQWFWTSLSSNRTLEQPENSANNLQRRRTHTRMQNGCEWNDCSVSSVMPPADFELPWNSWRGCGLSRSIHWPTSWQSFVGMPLTAESFPLHLPSPFLPYYHFPPTRHFPRVNFPSFRHKKVQSDPTRPSDWLWWLVAWLPDLFNPSILTVIHI